MSSMHLVIITPGFPANECDTTCIPGLQDLVQSYKRCYPQLKIHVIALHYPFREKYYQWNGIEVYAAGGENSKFRKLQTWLRVFRFIRTLQAKEPITVLHSFWLSESAFLGQIASRLHNIPHVATIMGQDAKRENKYLPLIGAIATDSMRVLALSEFAARIYFASTGRQVQGVIPFGVVPMGIVPALASEETKSLAKMRNIDILTVGSVIPLKNYLTFIDVVSAIKRQIPTIRAVIVGAFIDAKEVERLRSKITALNLEENIELAGEVSRGDVFAYMAQSKVLLHTSQYEGQGWVLLEALSYGADVVCFDVGFTMPHPQMHVCQNKQGLEFAVTTALESKVPAPHSPEKIHSSDNDTAVTVPSIDDTARSYIQLYRQFSMK